MSHVFLRENRISLPKANRTERSRTQNGTAAAVSPGEKVAVHAQTTLFIAAAALFAVAGTQAQAGGDTAGLDAALVSSLQGPSGLTADAGGTLTEATAAAGEMPDLGGDDD